MSDNLKTGIKREGAFKKCCNSMKLLAILGWLKFPLKEEATPGVICKLPPCWKK